MCVLTNKSNDFCSGAWIIPQGMGLGGAEGAQGWGSFIFEHGHVEYQIGGDDV